MEKERNAIEEILDPLNTENIILYDENDKPTEFEQIALIPLNNSVYVLLAPVEKTEGIGENEAVAFELIDDEENGEMLNLVVEEEITKQIFEEYKKMIEAEDEGK